MPHSHGVAGVVEPPDECASYSVLLDRQWRITALNAKARDRLQMGDESIGQSLWHLFPLSSASYARQILEEALTMGVATQFQYYGPELDAWFYVRVLPQEGGLQVLFDDKTEDDSAVLDGEDAWSTSSPLSDIANDLRKVADLIGGGALFETSAFRRPGGEGFTDRRLAKIAEAIYRDRRSRGSLLPVELGEPQWDILLDLFVHAVRGNRVSVSSAYIAADVPPSTASRALERLTTFGLVSRNADPEDLRRTWVALTEEGMNAMRSYLQQSSAAKHNSDA